MLTRLLLRNFRRHVETEIQFDESQIILIAGSNGVGKTTLLEAITYAFYGEGRHGSRRLANLVRRGAEHEAMEVELEFTVDGTNYLIQRRRTRTAASATLYGEGEILVAGNDAVTAEITRLFGMDATGYRLAVIAQQKELDGLAELQPRKRAEMLARLLNLNAISRAQKAARERYNRERDILTALGPAGDQEVVASLVVDAQQRHAEAQDAHREAAAALAELDDQIQATNDVEALYQAAVAAAAHHEGAVTGARAEVARIQADMQRVVLPEPIPAPARSLDELLAESSELDKQIARGEAIASEQRVAEVTRRDLEALSARRDQITARLAAAEGAAPPDVEKYRRAEQKASAALDAISNELALSRGALQGISTRLAAAAALGGDCDACGQAIPETHRHAQVERIQAEASELQTAITALEPKLAKAQAKVADARRNLDRALAEAAAAEQARLEAGRLSEERTSLEGRISTYQAQLQRFADVAVPDLDKLAATRTELTLAISHAQEHARQQAQLAVAEARLAEMGSALEAAQSRLAAAEAAVADAKVPAELEARYENRRQLLSSRAAEAEFVAACATQVAVAAEQVVAAQAAALRISEDLERRRRHESAAVIASLTSDVLGDLEGTLTSQIRPSLEGAVSQLLNLLSAGRYNKVAIDEQYFVTVEDDGQMRTLENFSGGEQDLIALAMRLALASMVNERGASADPGFLILDECFGSQDEMRRQSIMEALRALRSQYGQIFLISHVGGLEDQADAVLELEAKVEDGSRVAAIAV